MEWSESLRSLLRRAGRRHSARPVAKKAPPAPALEWLERREMPAAGLVAAYNFDEGAGTILHDYSGNNNNGTVSKVSWSGTGKYGGSLFFNGNNSMVTVSDSASLHLTTGMTLEAWVDPSTLSNWRTILEKETSNGQSYSLWPDSGTASTTSAKPAVYLTSKGQEYGATGTGKVLTGTWTFLAGTFDGQTLRLYVNGQLKASQAMSGSIDVSTNPLRLGGNTVWGEHFKGYIDNVRIYNQALTQAQIQADMNTAVSSGADTTAPTVSVTAPAGGATVSSTVTVSATASDNVGVTGVQFLLDGKNLGALDTTAPYSVSWDTTTAANGTHTLTALASDAAGNSTTSAAVTVTVSNTAAPPTANAGPNESGAEGAAITFAGSVTGGQAPLTYSWSFGDGGTATGTLTPAHTYQDAGTFTATLTATDSLGRSSSSSDTVTVTEVTPTASAGGPYSANTGTAISFSGSATDAPADLAGMKYSWAFGDGGTSAAQSPSHSYAAAGTYSATLTVTDPDGLSASATASVTVIAAPPAANAGPNQSGPEGSGITFAGSVTGGVAPFTYAWSFGDGGTATGTLTPSHAYQEPGAYTATLTVTDGQGRTSTASATATVTEVTPTASAGGPYSGTAGAAVSFSGSATDAPADLAGMKYSWAFGDGGTSAAQSPSHSYAAAGTYSATLTVTDPDGLSASATATVTVTSSPPVANAGPNKSGPEGSGVTFAGSVTGGAAPLTYSWAFGDGGTATGTLTPTHVYQEAGTYTATLTVTDLLGRVSTSSDTVTVSEVTPTASAGGPYSGTAGTAIAFSGSATDAPADLAGMKYSWSFGDGTTSTAQSPSHTYAAAATYQVSLTVTDPDGLTATASTTATVQAAGSGISTLWLQNFDGPGLPLDGDGAPYPYEMAPYNGSGGAEGGTATLSLDPTNSVTGSSLKVQLTSGNNFYLQFNPYNGANNPPNPNYPAGDSFARNYAQGAANWKFNYYTYLSFWVQLPNSEPDWSVNTSGYYAGDSNFNVGTYVKQVTNADPSSDEAGGNHYYHNLMLPTQVGGAWTHVVLNMHPDHIRGGGTVDPGVLAYPTAVNGPNGGADPANTYNYFDTLSRFYIEDDSLLGSATGFNAPATYRIDDVQFLHDPYAENDTQVYSVTSTYQASANRLVLTWMHNMSDMTNDEVRYSFTDIHQTGWAAATPAPNGVVAPLNSGGYNATIYDNSTLPLAGHSVVYVAIKPQDSSVFTEVAVPLTGNVTL